jgi:glycosyltransferase involved in cell wall biosynthesis
MKILYHHRTRSKDGQAVHIDEMIHALRQLGHEVIVVAPPGADDIAFGSDAGAVAWLKRVLPKFTYELMELAYSVVAYRQLAKAVEQHKPDCLYERYNLFLPAGIWLKRKYGLPMLLEVNSPIFEERARYDGLSLLRLARWSQRYTWRAADYVLPVSSVLARIVASYGVAPERIVVIPNGINAEQFGHAVDTKAAKRELGLEQALVLGFTGFVRDWHGLDRVITMIAEAKEHLHCHLLVVGDGPARAGLEKQATRLGVQDRITFTGVVQRDEVARYVSAFDIALQPAVVEYASPLKLFEYLALGKAIVAPDQPNIAEILTDGDNALLFDPDDADGMPAALERLCSDSTLRQNLANHARATIGERQLTWRANAERAVGLVGTLAHHA